MRPRRPSATVLLALLCPVLLVVGLWVGANPRLLPDPVRDLVVGDEEVQVVAEALDRIQRDYYREVPRSELANAALKGAVESLDDRFSAYFTPREYGVYREAASSQFSGVGTAVEKDRRGLRILRVYDGSPARRAGLKAGDVIVRANGRDLGGLPQEAAVGVVKGPEGTEVELTVLRDGERLTKRLTRATVNIPVVETSFREVDGEQVAVISLASFSSGAHGELYAAVRRAQRRDAQGIVLDLRGNPGGLVNEAQLVASAFLPEGPIVTTRGRSVPERTLNATGDPLAKDIPLVVLVDENSASAAEIVTGALKDRDRAVVVGQNTFGKGVFQEVVPLSNGGALDITIGQYFTPDGTNLGGKGVEKGDGVRPDVRAEDDPDTERDEALRAALRRLADELR